MAMINDLSLPAWGAWIEIPIITISSQKMCRSPHGERGLKLLAAVGLGIEW